MCTITSFLGLSNTNIEYLHYAYCKWWSSEKNLCKHVEGYLANSYIAHYAHYGN